MNATRPSQAEYVQEVFGVLNGTRPAKRFGIIYRYPGPRRWYAVRDESGKEIVCILQETAVRLASIWFAGKRAPAEIKIVEVKGNQ